MLGFNRSRLQLLQSAEGGLIRKEQEILRLSESRNTYSVIERETEIIDEIDNV
jgi:hypothetical protein